MILMGKMKLVSWSYYYRPTFESLVKVYWKDWGQGDLHPFESSEDRKPFNRKTSFEYTSSKPLYGRNEGAERREEHQRVTKNMLDVIEKESAGKCRFKGSN